MLGIRQPTGRQHAVVNVQMLDKSGKVQGTVTLEADGARQLAEVLVLQADASDAKPFKAGRTGGGTASEEA